MTTDEIKDYVVEYLLRSGFVSAYVKKLMFPSDIDNYYEDYLQGLAFYTRTETASVGQTLRQRTAEGNRLGI